jgi:hypothetical protein
MGGNTDVPDGQGKEDWTSKKGTRRDFVGRTTCPSPVRRQLRRLQRRVRRYEADRQKIVRGEQGYFGHDWIVIANPDHSSFQVGALQIELQALGGRAPPEEDRRCPWGPKGREEKRTWACAEARGLVRLHLR